MIDACNAPEHVPILGDICHYAPSILDQLYWNRTEMHFERGDHPDGAGVTCMRVAVSTSDRHSPRISGGIERFAIGLGGGRPGATGSVRTVPTA